MDTNQPAREGSGILIRSQQVRDPLGKAQLITRTRAVHNRVRMFQRCWSAILSGCMRRRATPKLPE